jgi:sugar lactone lactonase YvrE
MVLAIAGCQSMRPATRGDIRIDDTNVFPESVTSTAAGAVMVGSIKGIVYRALPRESVAHPWIRPDATNGLRAVFGVLADERSATLWVCSVPNPFARPATPVPSSVAAFDLASGRYKASYPFPGSSGVCNDIAVATDGTVYATDTPGGRILQLRRGASALETYAEDPRLKGIDGLAFSATGVLYVNNVSRGTLIRIDRDAAGHMRSLTELVLSRPLAGPDGFRLIAGNRFLLAEGTGGRIDEVSIDGDSARIRVLREGLNASPGVTRVGSFAYAIEGKIGYLIDPALKGQDPGAFMIRAIPLK